MILIKGVHLHSSSQFSLSELTRRASFCILANEWCRNNQPSLHENVAVIYS